jgi:hypothetical protein
MSSFRGAGVVVLLLGLGVLAVNVPPVLASLRAAGWPETTATVTRSEVAPKTEDSLRQELWTLTVRYTYTVDGTEYEGTEIRFGREPAYETEEIAADAAAAFALNATVPVYYDPETPARAVLVRETGVRAVYTVVAAAVLIGIGIWLVRPSRRERRVPPPAGPESALANE